MENGLLCLRLLASRHEGLQLSRLLDCGGEVFIARLGDENVVLDANTAHVPVLGEHIGVNVLAVLGVLQVRIDDELAKVDTGLNSHNTTSGNLASQAQVLEDDIGVLAVVVTASVVGIHAQVVSQAVGEEGLAGSGLEDLVLVALEDADGQQAVNGNLVGQDVGVFPVHAGLEDGHGLFLHLEDDVVNVATLFGKLAVEREGSCDIGSVVVPLGTSINQQVLLSSQGSNVGDVVKSRRSRAAGNNGGVCHVLGAVGNASLQEDSLEFPLVGCLLCFFNDGLVGQAGDVVGLADHGHLELVLDDSRNLDGLLEESKVLVLEPDKGDVIRDLAVDGVDGRG